MDCDLCTGEVIVILFLNTQMVQMSFGSHTSYMRNRILRYNIVRGFNCWALL